MSPLIALLFALAVQDAEPAAPKHEAPVPPKVEVQPADVLAEEEEAEPTVSIRTEPNGDRVEEYRRNGRVFMVRVTPAKGVPYQLMDTDNNGRLNRDDRDPRVSPVHWTVYEWD